MAQILRMYRGDDRTFPLTLEWDGAAVDVSAALDIRFTARVSPSDSDAPVIERALFDGIEFESDGTDGRIKVSIPGSATAHLNAGEVLRWDVEVQGIVGSGAEPYTRTWPETAGVPELGKLIVVGDVTREAAS